MDKRSCVVAGPGHTLNELTNRLLYTTYNGLEKFHLWEMYPGPLGLYARHCDDYNFQNLPDQLVDFYNDFIRNHSKETGYMYSDRSVSEFKAMISDTLPSFYLNVFDLDRVANDFGDRHLFTSILDLPNSKHRHHHLMMEFSTGATDRDTAYVTDLKTLCKRLVKKNNSELQFIETIPECFHVVKIEDLLNNNFDVLYQENKSTVFEHNLKAIIKEYNFVNQCSNSMLLQINEMSWDEIIAVSS